VQAVGDAFWHQRDTGNCTREVLKEAQVAGDEMLGAPPSVSSTNLRGRNWGTPASLSEQIFGGSSFKPEDGKYPRLTIRKESLAREKRTCREECSKGERMCGGTQWPWVFVMTAGVKEKGLIFQWKR